MLRFITHALFFVVVYYYHLWSKPNRITPFIPHFPPPPPTRSTYTPSWGILDPKAQQMHRANNRNKGKTKLLYRWESNCLSTPPKEACLSRPKKLFELLSRQIQFLVSWKTWKNEGEFRLMRSASALPSGKSVAGKLLNAGFTDGWVWFDQYSWWTKMVGLV